LQNGLILLGVSSYWSPLFVGLVILISVSVTAWSQRERRATRVRA
jgi:simple sugar transport system permease protein